jgi:4-hydroxy-tetrahydrodipicolinate synthase
MTLELEGVYVPVVTPFDGNGDVDLATLGAVIERGLEAGVGGIVSCGTTGEYYALSESERVDVMRHTHDVAAGRAQLVAGCNAGSTRTAIQLARVAGDIGYDALMLAVPPTSLPRADELVAHFTAIAEASGVPTILYNYPARAGVEIGFDCLDQVADHPLIVGIKESSGDFSRFLAMRERYAGRITIMCGSDDQAADYFFWGVRSWLAGTANVLPRQHVEILNAANSGDLAGARKQFEQILPWVQHMEAGSYNQKTKLGLRHLGLDCGDVRQPLLPLSDADAATLVEILDGVLR